MRKLHESGRCRPGSRRRSLLFDPTGSSTRSEPDRFPGASVQYGHRPTRRRPVRPRRGRSGLLRATLHAAARVAAGLVGPLDERFFMYYEDVDWCLRAGIPGVQVPHLPDGGRAARALSDDPAIEVRIQVPPDHANFVRTILKDFQGRRAYPRQPARRSLGLARDRFRGPYRWQRPDRAEGTSRSAFPRSGAAAARSNPAAGERYDQFLFNFSHGEQGFFDPTGYSQIRALATLHAMYAGATCQPATRMTSA